MLVKFFNFTHSQKDLRERNIWFKAYQHTIQTQLKPFLEHKRILPEIQSVSQLFLLNVTDNFIRSIDNNWLTDFVLLDFYFWSMSECADGRKIIHVDQILHWCNPRIYTRSSSFYNLHHKLIQIVSCKWLQMIHNYNTH